MSRGPQSFRQADVEKAMKALVKSGQRFGRIEIAAGKVTIFADSAPTAPEQADVNEWDEVK